MPGPTMSRKASRERAERVVLARAVLRTPWRDIMRNEGFTSVGAVQQTYKREMARRKLSARDLAELTAQEILERRDTSTRLAVSQLMEAKRVGDTSGMAAMLREIRQNDVETAKMLGLYAPERAEVDVKVHQSATAIIDRAEAELLALTRANPNIIEAEVVEP